jgi:drug/metabolite transporter superfamily protein YnfA
MSFVYEFWQYMRSRKKLWILPIVIVFLLIAGLLVLTQVSAIAPFIYALF